MSNKNNKTIVVPVNNHFSNLTINEEEAKYNNTIAELFKIKKKISIKESNTNNYNIKVFSNRQKKTDEEKLVFEITENENKEKVIKTGLYIGFLNINGIKLYINSGYNDTFLKRMLNISNNISFDTGSTSSADVNNVSNNSLLENLVKYLFLVSFKSAYEFGLPKVMSKKQAKGLNTKGKIDFKNYVKEDIVKGTTFSYSYGSFIYVQEIIDILYNVFLKINKDFFVNTLDNGKQYIFQLKELYSGRKDINNLFSSKNIKKVLLNPLYSRYKKVLNYAKMILSNTTFLPDNSSGENISGILVDISELWEDYLVNIIKTHMPNFNVFPQDTIDVAKGTFYERTNYPDIVAESDDNLFIIDAKYKKMSFKGTDVDRADLHQIYSYGFNYYIRKKDKFSFCALAYPTINDNNDIETFASINSDKETNKKIGVLYYQVKEKLEEIKEQEIKFVDRIRKHL